MQRPVKIFFSILLSTALTVGLIPATCQIKSVRADNLDPWFKDADTGTSFCLNTDGIRNPDNGKGGWSIVYYGKYNSNPVPYRVLSKRLPAENGFITKDADKRVVPAMLLDCDIVLGERVFDASNQSNNHVWGNSEIRDWLTKEDKNDSFLNTSFTSLERSAIANTEKSEKAGGDGSGAKVKNSNNIFKVLKFAKLTGEKIFLLDVFEVTRSSYGYKDNGEDGNGNYSFLEKTRDKGAPNTTCSWWLRSVCDDVDDSAGIVLDKVDSGYIATRHKNNENQQQQNRGGASPVFNINLESVLFSSAISGTPGNAGTSYKLTILDKDLKVSVPAGEKAERVKDDEGKISVKVPYQITGNHKEIADKLSVLMLDKPYSPGNTYGASIKYFKDLAPEGGLKTNGSIGYVTFDLPENYDSSWNVYLVVSDRYGQYETDLAAISGSTINDSFRWYTDSEDNRTICLSNSGLKNPDFVNYEGWSYVYYGKYGAAGEEAPVRYRMLSRKLYDEDGFTTKDGADNKVSAMFLDCDSGLFSSWFDFNDNNIWYGPDRSAPLRNLLTGDNENSDLYAKRECFTPLEKASITKSSKVTGEENVYYNYNNNTVDIKYYGSTLHDDHIFLLDAEEVTNPVYGYEKTGTSHISRKKDSKNDEEHWWLRSPFSGFYTKVGVVNYRCVEYEDSRFIRYASPAFNVNRDEILYSTLLTGNAGEAGAEYKLVLKDPELNINLAEEKITTSGNTLIIPYTLSGNNAVNADTVSVLITDKEYDREDAEILQYGMLITDGAPGSSGTGLFTIDPEEVPELDCHVYVLSEDRKGGKETESVSIPQEIHKHDFTYSAEENTISAECRAYGICDLNERKVTLVINPPALKLQGSDRSPKATLVGLNGFNETTGLSVTEEDIRYTGTGDTVYEESEIPPVTAGTYRAGITVKGVTAFVDYKIDKEPDEEKRDERDEREYKVLDVKGKTLNGTVPEISLSFPLKTVSYNGRAHVALGTEIPEKKKKKKVLDLDIVVKGLPASVSADFLYKNNMNASEDKAYYYIKLKPDKDSEEYKALMKAGQKQLGKEIKKINKELKKKENRLLFPIKPLDLQDFTYDKENSSEAAVIFIRKDGSGDKLTVSPKTVTAEISGFSFKIPKKEYTREDSEGAVTISGKNKNLTGTIKTGDILPALP